ELAGGAMAVLLVAHAGFQRAEHADLAFDRDAGRMWDVYNLPGDCDIVVVIGWRLALLLQRAVHHHGGEAVLDGGDAGGKVVAVVEMHANGNVWIHFRKPVDQARKYAIARSEERRVGDENRIKTYAKCR